VGTGSRQHHGELKVANCERREGDRDTIERWARAEGTDLENEAQKAKQKLRNVDRARK
jgi:hypothetical protein